MSVVGVDVSGLVGGGTKEGLRSELNAAAQDRQAFETTERSACLLAPSRERFGTWERE